MNRHSIVSANLKQIKMPKEIEIKITIPYAEYKKWEAYKKGGFEQLKEALKKDLYTHFVADDIINYIEIEVTQN